MYYTEAQQERAQQAVALHEAMGHPSDAALIEMLKSPSLINCPISASDVSNARAIYGPCSVCLEGKPRPVKGSNASLDQFTVTAPGQLLHVDVAFIQKVPHLFCVDDLSGFMSMVRLISKASVAVQNGLLTIINFYRSHLKVVQMVSSDHEAVFLSCEQFLNSHGIKYRARIPGEHEVIAERGMRRVREAMRTKMLELTYQLPVTFLPFLALHCVDCMNFIPNSRSRPLMPIEMVQSEKINWRTDFTALFGHLVLVQANDSAVTGMPAQKNEFGIALGRVTNTRGSVWVYRRGHEKIAARRVIKAVPMTNDWLQHIAELAERKPTDPEMIFEFRSTLEYGASDRHSDDLEENGEPHTLIKEINEPQGHTEQPVNAPFAIQPNPQIPTPPVLNEPVVEPSSPPEAPEPKPGASAGGSPVKSPSPQKRSQPK